MAEKGQAAAAPTIAKPSMVERVARALCAKRNAHVGSPDADTLVRGKPNWVFHVPDALTAIEAMREPTPEMLETAWKATVNADPVERMEVMLMAARPAHDVKMRNRYGAMIDAALASDDPLTKAKGVAAA